MRIHVTACVYVLFFASQLALTRGEMACLLLAVGSVITAEMLNTSLEKLCDFTQKKTNRYIRLIKDIAAGAVFVCAMFAALVGVVVLCRDELWAALYGILLDPVSVLLFGASLAVALVFIFVGPVGISEKTTELFRKKNGK